MYDCETAIPTDYHAKMLSLMDNDSEIPFATDCVTAYLGYVATNLEKIMFKVALALVAAVLFAGWTLGSAVSVNTVTQALAQAAQR
jgi:hypothetical protein